MDYRVISAGGHLLTTKESAEVEILKSHQTAIPHKRCRQCGLPTVDLSIETDSNETKTEACLNVGCPNYMEI